MNFIIQNFSSIFLLITGAVALLKFRCADKEYWPFFLFIWAGCLSEVLAFAAGYIFRNNHPVYNSYVLLEGLLLVSMFFNFKVLGRDGKIFYTVLLVLGLAWLGELMYYGTLLVRFSAYRLLLSVVVVVMAVQLLTLGRGGFTQAKTWDPRRYIALALVLYFTYKILVECILFYGLTRSVSFQIKVVQLMQVVDLVSTLLYLMAIITVRRPLQGGGELRDHAQRRGEPLGNLLFRNPSG